MSFARSLSRRVWPLSWRLRYEGARKKGHHSKRRARALVGFIKQERGLRSCADHPRSTAEARIRWEAAQ